MSLTQADLVTLEAHGNVTLSMAQADLNTLVAGGTITMGAVPAAPVIVSVA